MDIVITEWALDTYLNLKGTAFTAQDYRSTLRPDVLLLKAFPNDPKFSQNKFWSAAQDPGGGVLPDGFKMKWHNLGPGKVQLRLAVGLPGRPRQAVLCEAYVKSSPTAERRKLARFRTHLELIRQGRYVERGRLS